MPPTQAICRHSAGCRSAVGTLALLFALQRRGIEVLEADVDGDGRLAHLILELGVGEGGYDRIGVGMTMPADQDRLQQGFFLVRHERCPPKDRRDGCSQALSLSGLIVPKTGRGYSMAGVGCALKEQSQDQQAGDKSSQNTGEQDQDGTQHPAPDLES